MCLRRRGIACLLKLLLSAVVYAILVVFFLSGKSREFRITYHCIRLFVQIAFKSVYVLDLQLIGTFAPFYWKVGPGGGGGGGGTAKSVWLCRRQCRLSARCGVATAGPGRA